MRKLLITGAAVVILGGAVAGSVLLARGSATGQPATQPALPPAIAVVTKTTLVDTRTVAGTLGYGDLATISAQEIPDTLLAGPTEQQLAQGKLAVIQAQQAVTTAQRSLASAMNPSVSYYQEQVDRAQQTLTAAQQNAQITDFQTSLNAAADALTTATNSLQTIKDLDARYPGYGSERDRLKNAQAAYDRAQQDYQTALFRLQQAQNNDAINIQNAQQALTTAQANLAAVQSGSDQAKVALYQAQLDVAKANLAQAQSDLDKLQANPIGATGTGTLTWIAPVGATVKRGEPLIKVDGRPVVALYGSVPLYRALRDGLEGADVQQLEQNLAELGYTGFTVDTTYTSATAEAVRTWQADLGLPETGTVEMGQVVFTSGAVRIAEHIAYVGDTLRGVPVLSYTGTTRLVTVELEVADQALAVAGRKVTITVPGRKAVEGEISQVGTVITAGNDSGARIEVTVTIADQEALGSLDAAPADVDFVSEERKDVLAVPVAALLALPEGGYGVEIVDGDTTRIVAVKTGMFAAGRVEVSGEGIAEGVTVGMPK